MTKHKEIVCTVIGDAMIDIILPLTGKKDVYCLSQGGVVNADITVSPGGAANVAYYISKLGLKSSFIGKVGDDLFGRMIMDDLDDNGITANLAITKSRATGLVVSLVMPDGDRFFIVDRGANAYLKFSEVDTKLIGMSEYLYITGFSFQDESTEESIRTVLKETQSDLTIVFNPGAANIAKKYRNKFLDIITQYVDIIILNEDEGKCLTGFSKEHEIVDFLLTVTHVVALTRGGKGSIIAKRDLINNIEACNTRVVDTTGAGDAYAAGILYVLAKGGNLAEAGELASKLAGRAVAHWGARFRLHDFC